MIVYLFIDPPETGSVNWGGLGPIKNLNEREAKSHS
jgi:hypothetical protein